LGYDAKLLAALAGRLARAVMQHAFGPDHPSRQHHADDFARRPGGYDICLNEHQRASASISEHQRA